MQSNALPAPNLNVSVSLSLSLLNQFLKCYSLDSHLLSPDLVPTLKHTIPAFLIEVKLRLLREAQPTVFLVLSKHCEKLLKQGKSMSHIIKVQSTEQDVPLGLSHLQSNFLAAQRSYMD